MNSVLKQISQYSCKWSLPFMNVTHLIFKLFGSHLGLQDLIFFLPNSLHFSEQNFCFLPGKFEPQTLQSLRFMNSPISA